MGQLKNWTGNGRGRGSDTQQRATGWNRTHGRSVRTQPLHVGAPVILTELSICRRMLATTVGPLVKNRTITVFLLIEPITELVIRSPETHVKLQV